MNFFVLLTFFFCLLNNPAAAHALHTSSVGFASGLVHPFLGLDHLALLALLGVFLALIRRPFMLGLVFVAVLFHGHMHIEHLFAHGIEVQVLYPFAMFLSSALIVYAVRRCTQRVITIWQQNCTK